MLSIREVRTSAWVVHPHHPEIRVKVNKPTRAEWMERRHAIDSYSDRVVAVNPITREPIRDKDGNLEIVTLPPRVPLWDMTEFLAKHVTRIEGIAEADAEIVDVLKGFLKDDFDVTEPLLRDGKPVLNADGTQETTNTAFTIFLFYKVMAEDTYKSPDPTVETSSSQQISA